MVGGGIIPKRCPHCAGPLKYIVKYNAWYCKACKGYRDVEEVVVEVIKVRSRPSVPSVVPQSSTAVKDRCNICLGLMDDEGDYFQCKCGNISHGSCATRVGKCSACGNQHTGNEFIKS